MEKSSICPLGKTALLVFPYSYFTSPNTSVTNRHRSPPDQRPTYFSAHRAGDRPIIDRKPGQFVASGGVRINYKSHLKIYQTSGPGRNRVEIETRSDDQRTGIARRSPDIGFIERVSAKVNVFPRGIYIGRRPSDCRRASERCPTDA
ncbi:hypothetical protein DPMN_108498 [Dreissena polymorpha]|uniref:Uncharacterized protein n=1 Tax=Dreissena polymorpha TaxID=45954 RepID=A0A9D4K973_DREPO|nr:hypothetical protein DPMN_108498 [Dreissena polymorpha]